MTHLNEHHSELYAEALTLQKSIKKEAAQRTQNQLKQSQNNQQ